MGSLVLIASERCPHSKKLISLISKNEELSKKMKLFFIENIAPPKGVTSVPTIVEDDRLYEGKDAFEFVKERSDSDIESFEFGSRMVGNSGWSFVGNGESPQVGTFTFLTENGFENDGHNEMGPNTTDSTSAKKDDRLQALIDERNNMC